LKEKTMAEENDSLTGAYNGGSPDEQGTGDVRADSDAVADAGQREVADDTGGTGELPPLLTEARDFTTGVPEHDSDVCLSDTIYPPARVRDRHFRAKISE
jgi:hypothetical protein